MNYCKVLIIDDEMITRQGIKHMIVWENEGFQIIGEATNGQEGLELIQKQKPDIVLADIMMPVMNGIDFSFILHEKYPEIQLIMLSSYDDFEYVKASLFNGAVDYVLKPTLNPEILLTALNKAVHNIAGMKLNRKAEVSVDHQLERYLLGYQDALDVSAFREKFPYKHYCIMAIDLKLACDNNKGLMERIVGWISRAWREGHEYKYISIFIEDEILCYVFNYLKKDEHDLKTDIQNMADKVENVTERALFVLSESFLDFTSVKAQYQNAVIPCLKQKFYFSDRNLIMTSEFSAEQEIKRFEYDRFTELLGAKRYDKAMTILKDYTAYLCSCMYDEYLAKNLVKNLLYNFLMSADDCGISSEMLKGEYFKKIDAADDADSFMKCCKSIFQEFETVYDAIGVNNDRRIQEIKNYIWEHSGEKLDLTEIATVFGFNYHYISSYFNQHISEGFSGYLNKIRIEKACVLLKDKKIPIADISGEVGYSDHGYFCRVFKKHTGKTPSQYRRSLKE